MSPDPPQVTLPPGVAPVTTELELHAGRLAQEVRIIRTPDFHRSPYQWGRERWFTRKYYATYIGRKLLAYSVDKRGRIIRGWYLTKDDQMPDSAYRKREVGCPVEAAWLPTLKVGSPSEPAWLYLRPTP